MCEEMNEKNIIQIDLSGCKNWNECMKVIELITSGRVKIKKMEKDQIVDAATWGALAETGEKYYKEKYKKD